MIKLPSSHMKLLRVFPLILILVGAVLLFERPAYAYADPGSGLLAIQAAGSALVATGWYLRRKIYALFIGRPRPNASRRAARRRRRRGLAPPVTGPAEFLLSFESPL